MKKWFGLLALVLVSGCGGDSETGTTTTTMTVHPGESIQAAVAAAPTNTTILVEPGVYHESAGAPSAIVITKDGITLKGQPTASQPVVLENAGSQQNGIVVAPTDSVDIANDDHPGEHPPCGDNGHLIHGFQLQGFTVRGFDQFGVYLACVDGFTLNQNFTDADQLYGLFPVRSHNGTLADNETQHTTSDAALYVGQSDHVTITGNRTHDNVLGLEIENSSDITAMHNDVFNNTLGIIADAMPGLQKKDQTNVLIADNDVHDNNLPNPSGEGESTDQTPPGTGLVVLAGSTVTVQNNRVHGNEFAGIIVAGFCTQSPPPCTDLDIDPDPKNVHVVDNEVMQNGTNPPADPLLALLAADLVWDKTGTGNCWAGNTPSATAKILNGGHQLPICQ
jgi:parallel beta-helix repeat protein